TDDKKEIDKANVLHIGIIAEGIPIYNIELSRGVGGKLARSAGNNATVISHDSKKTVIQLPSGQFKALDSLCRASVGITAGSGRKDKPFLKAGKKHHAYRARGKLYPVVRGVAMCAVSHPHGGGGHQHVGKPSTVKRNASPGRKVGSIAAKRTGRK
ncbi:MAG: 50S ribosomal protein L2, partial [Thermoplasmatales archaeon]